MKGQGWTQVLLVLAALGVRLWLFFGGVRGADAYAYAHHAYNMTAGQYQVAADAMSYGVRYTVLLPTALAYALFGVGDWQSALFPLLASLAAVWMVIRLGALWLDARAGLAAGLLYAVYPLDLPWATLLGPDSFLPALSAGALLAFWLAGEHRRSPASRRALYLLSGMCVGLAAQARETGLLLLPVLAVLAWSRPARGRIMLTIAVGVVAPLLVELAYYRAAVGNPIHRLAILEKLNDLYVGGSAEGPTSLAYYPRAMLGLDLEGLAWYGLFPVTAVAAAALAAWKRDLRRLTPILVWIVLPLLYLEFGSLSVSHYAPVSKHYSFLTIVSVPIVLLCAYGLVRAWDLGTHPEPRTIWRGAAAAALAVLALPSVYGTSRLLGNFRDDARPYEVVASAVQARPEQPVYLPHDRWALFLNYHLRYRTGFNYYAQRPGEGRLRDVRELSRGAPEMPAYVVVHDRYLFYDVAGRPVDRPDLPEAVRHPPQTWRVVLSERGEPAYNSFAVYETGAGPLSAAASAGKPGSL
jgi:4-amino-4-deoxy-L-arabinose transferase-like glycosyltransferase